MTVLFDLKAEHDSRIVHSVNQTLEKHNQPYLDRFGSIASTKWWKLYEQGKISRLIRAGEIIALGSSVDDFDDEAEVVCILTDRGLLEYVQEDFWRIAEVHKGVWVQIVSVEVECQTSTGALTHVIDVKVSLLEEAE